MKKAIYTASALLFISITIISTPAFANSSWHWLTYSPYYIFPYAVVFTLIAETAVLSIINKTKVFRTFTVVAAANVLSFLAPVFMALFSYMEVHTVSGPLSGIKLAMNSMPSYIVGVSFLAMTLVVEVPVVKAFLSKGMNKEQVEKLRNSVIGVNIVTTVCIAIVEHTLCIGSW